MKTINFKSKTLQFSVMLLVVAIAFVACKPTPPTPPLPPKPPTQNPPQDPKGKGNCELTGILSNDECLPSIIDGFAIVDDATGIFLAPCESNVTFPKSLKPGDKVEFSYEEINGSSCEELIVCQRHITSPYKFVRITCFKTKTSIAP